MIFRPSGPTAAPRARVLPRQLPEEAKAKFIPSSPNDSKTTKIAAGTELTLTEVVAARPLAEGEDPLLEADRIAASILLRKPGKPVDLKAAADGIAGFFKHCELWEPNALGPGRGWFRNMWTRTCTGAGGELKFNGAGRKEGPNDFNGHYDLTWGEGFAVYNWTGIVRHWKRTGDTELLKYVDEMTKNMELFKRGSGPDEPYYDRRHAGTGQFADYPGRKIIWSHLLGRVGSETIKLYQSAPDYPNPQTRKQWLAAATGIGNFFAKHQQANGDIQDTFDENNRETLTDGRRCSARAVVCGLWTRLGQVTGDKAWTQRAVRLAKVVAPAVKRYEFYNAHVDHWPGGPCKDVEAPFYVLDGLVPLYEETRDPEVLAACKAAAAFAISWTYFYDVPIPMTHNGVARGGQICCTCYSDHLRDWPRRCGRASVGHVQAHRRSVVQANGGGNGLLHRPLANQCAGQAVARRSDPCLLNVLRQVSWPGQGGTGGHRHGYRRQPGRARGLVGRSGAVWQKIEESPVNERWVGC